MDNIKEMKAQKNREAVKKCMKNKDRINIILPLGTIDRINSYGLKTSAFARELILSELDKMDKMKKQIHYSKVLMYQKKGCKMTNQEIATKVSQLINYNVNKEGVTCKEFAAQKKLNYKLINAYGNGTRIPRLYNNVII